MHVAANQIAADEQPADLDLADHAIGHLCRIGRGCLGCRRGWLGFRRGRLRLTLGCQNTRGTGRTGGDKRAIQKIPAADSIGLRHAMVLLW